MSTTPKLPTATSGLIRTKPEKADVAKFLDDLQAREPVTTAGRGRLIFALDATASREPTWDHACHVQHAMFDATAGLGGISTQLAFFRGYDECKASRWMVTATELHRVTRSVTCLGGHTQIRRILEHVIRETKDRKVAALVFVGDAMEEEVDTLAHLASELGTLSTPCFMLQEGGIPVAATTFQVIAERTGGAYLNFDLASLDRLKELLAAIAIFVTGNKLALEDYGRKKGGEVLRLTSQLQQPKR